MSKVTSHLKTQNKDLQEASDRQRMILDTIGSNGHDREIILRLRAGESHHSIADWLCKQHPISRKLSIVPPSKRSLIDVVKNLERHYQEKDGPNRTGTPSAVELQWTKVTSSQILIAHLFDLYFTWVHPVHMLFSELDFKHSFRNNDQTYCSSPLVNAICAMGCHLLDNDSFDTMTKDVDITTLKEGFLTEARENLLPDSYRCMTSIQTFAVMYLVDVSSGKARSATGYLRSAVDNLKSTDGGSQSAEARELSEWGIQTLNRCEPSILSPLKDDLTGKVLVQASLTRSSTRQSCQKWRSSGMFGWMRIMLYGDSIAEWAMNVSYPNDPAMLSRRHACRLASSASSTKASIFTVIIGETYPLQIF